MHRFTNMIQNRAWLDRCLDIIFLFLADEDTRVRQIAANAFPKYLSHSFCSIPPRPIVQIRRSKFILALPVAHTFPPQMGQCLVPVDLHSSSFHSPIQSIIHRLHRRRPIGDHLVPIRSDLRSIGSGGDSHTARSFTSSRHTLSFDDPRFRSAVSKASMP